MYDRDLGTASADASVNSVALSVSDRGELRSLHTWLRDVPSLSVAIESTLPAPGELGAGDLLVMTGSSAGLVAAIKILPEFIRSRRSRVQISITHGDLKIDVTEENAKDAAALVGRVLDSAGRTGRETERSVDN